MPSKKQLQAQIDDLEQRLSKDEQLWARDVELDCNKIMELRDRLGANEKFLHSVGFITAMIWYWLHKAPFQSPTMDRQNESSWVKFCENLGLKLPQNERKLLYGDIHRHVADFLRDRGICPEDGVRQKPFRP